MLTRRSHVRVTIRWSSRRRLLFPHPGQETREVVLDVVLDRFQTGPGRRGADYIGVCWHVSLPAILPPGFLFAAKVALHPRDGDEGPEAGPSEGEGPAQLVEC
jgi:hypothetical protein